MTKEENKTKTGERDPAEEAGNIMMIGIVLSPFVIISISVLILTLLFSVNSSADAVTPYPFYTINFPEGTTFLLTNLNNNQNLSINYYRGIGGSSLSDLIGLRVGDELKIEIFTPNKKTIKYFTRGGEPALILNGTEYLLIDNHGKPERVFQEMLGISRDTVVFAEPGLIEKILNDTDNNSNSITEESVYEMIKQEIILRVEEPGVNSVQSPVKAVEANVSGDGVKTPMEESKPSVTQGNGTVSEIRTPVQNNSDNEDKGKTGMLLIILCCVIAVALILLVFAGYKIYKFLKNYGNEA